MRTPVHACAATARHICRLYIYAARCARIWATRAGRVKSRASTPAFRHAGKAAGLLVPTPVWIFFLFFQRTPSNWPKTYNACLSCFNVLLIRPLPSQLELSHANRANIAADRDCRHMTKSAATNNLYHIESLRQGNRASQACSKLGRTVQRPGNKSVMALRQPSSKATKLEQHRVPCSSMHM